MAKVFVSFDYEHDRHYKYLLQAWSANPRFELSFEDLTPGEIDSNNIGRIKAALSTQINDAVFTLILVGQYVNQPHPKRDLIGKVNWVNWEISKSIEAHNLLVAVRLEPSCPSPLELARVYSVTWIEGFDEAAIRRAIGG